MTKPGRKRIDIQPRRVVGCGLSGAIIAAPFLALLYDFNLALGMTVLALATTSWLARDAARTAPPALVNRLRWAGRINAMLALLCLAALVLRLLI